MTASTGAIEPQDCGCGIRGELIPPLKRGRRFGGWLLPSPSGRGEGGEGESLILRDWLRPLTLTLSRGERGKTCAFSRCRPNQHNLCCEVGFRMSNKNKHGVTRNIPEAIKRSVRNRDGFGCIHCGNAFFQYDHFIEPYSEIQFHDPDDIVLLCASCHDRKTRGRLSLETLKRSKEHPKAREDGHSWGPLDVGPLCPLIRLATTTFEETRTIFQVYGEKVLGIDEPETESGPYRLTALFRKSNGDPFFQIVQNEMLISPNGWDAVLVGQRLQITSKRKIHLSMRTIPPNTIEIEKMDIFHRDINILVDQSGIKIGDQYNQLQLRNCHLKGFDVAVNFE